MYIYSIHEYIYIYVDAYLHVRGGSLTLAQLLFIGTMKIIIIITIFYFISHDLSPFNLTFPPL